jgi:NADH dehydrogenase/NADH:ubiquinone oxidoreductase subunit G
MNDMTPLKTPPPPPLVTVTVDGQELQLPKGKNLLHALLDAGVYVPHYCYHPALSIAGNCRLCLVEIEGRPKPEVSCNMTVSEGLKIKVNSPLVEDCRKGMMEFLLVNHPLDCPICDRGGECMLQRYSMDYGTGTARTVDNFVARLRAHIGDDAEQPRHLETVRGIGYRFNV